MLARLAEATTHQDEVMKYNWFKEGYLAMNQLAEVNESLSSCREENIFYESQLKVTAKGQRKTRVNGQVYCRRCVCDKHQDCGSGIF